MICQRNMDDFVCSCMIKHYKQNMQGTAPP